MSEENVSVLWLRKGWVQAGQAPASSLTEPGWKQTRLPWWLWT